MDGRAPSDYKGCTRGHGFERPVISLGLGRIFESIRTNPSKYPQ
jgi:hypothetical protein